MAIPDSQLDTCANQGALVTSQDTYTSVKNALSSYKGWPSDLQYDVYLQGSYKNATNIYGNSDVDINVEMTSVYYSNLTESEKRSLNWQPGKYNWIDFRSLVLSALMEYYSSRLVDTSGSKSIKVLPDSGRLKADIVPSVTYKYYENSRIRSEGIIFWNYPQQTIDFINYPKPHLNNGAQKNSAERTRNWYKRTIRIYKNAREKLTQNTPSLRGQFPSYFIENLLYNVPDAQFGGSYEQAFCDPLNWLCQEIWTDHANDFVCQNEMYYLFRDTPVTWNLADAKEYVQQLVDLWKNW
jgi:hypothetical protein